MNKGFIFLDDVLDVNHFDQVEELEVIHGNESKIYFQIVDPDGSFCDDFYHRILPQGTTIEVDVAFTDIDDECQVDRSAIQPFSDDKSIWCVDVLSDERFSPNSIEVTLTVDGKEEKLVRLGQLRFRDTNKRTQFC